MIKFIKNLFKPKSRFNILYYPLSQKYYVQFNGYWLKKTYCTGIIQKENYFAVADYFDTKEEALEFIDMFKEQYFMKTVVKIDVD